MLPIPDSPLVSTAWLAQNLRDPNIRVVDVRWRSRYENGRGIGYDDLDGYRAGHIPGAVFVGMAGELTDHNHEVPDMLVNAEAFGSVMARLGIGEDTLVVSYDDMGYPLGAARLWWALSFYGHDRVRVLDGGLRQWQLDGQPLSKETPAVGPATFNPRPRSEWLATKQDVLAALDNPGAVIVDSLPPEQYRGDGENTLWGARAGHIPGAINVPALANIGSELATATSSERASILEGLQSFTFTDNETLSALYRNAGVTGDRSIIAYCGRGYAAACGLLAMKALGYEDARLYDGSWAEWSVDPDLPVAVGPDAAGQKPTKS